AALEHAHQGADAAVGVLGLDADDGRFARRAVHHDRKVVFAADGGDGGRGGEGGFAYAFGHDDAARDALIGRLLGGSEQTSQRAGVLGNRRLGVDQNNLGAGSRFAIGHRDGEGLALHLGQRLAGDGLGRRHGGQQGVVLALGRQGDLGRGGSGGFSFGRRLAVGAGSGQGGDGRQAQGDNNGT